MKLIPRYVPYLFVAPFILILLLFNIFPFGFTFVISFFEWDGFSLPSFHGLSNYIRLFSKNSRFLKSIINTFVILLLSLPITISMSLIVANILNSSMIRIRRFLGFLNFLPYITTPVAIGIIWALVFDWKYGIANEFLISFNLINKPINWLGDPIRARVVLAIILIWKNFGYLILIFSTALYSIPIEQYEAAKVDGANAIKEFFYITIPNLIPVLIFVTITGIIMGLQLFDEPFLLFDGGITSTQGFGGPEKSCLTMLMNFYETVYRSYDYGFGASIAIGTFFVIGVFSFTSLKIMMHKEDKNEKE